jgi:hypothetical protein
MISLKKHPFAVEAFFESSLVLTFALPFEQLLPLLPPCLQLDTFQNRWAFLAAAMVQTKKLRPKGFPKWIGQDFFLIGYRIFVRYTDRSGRQLRGLYILRSETNKKRMEFLGNLFTHYNYRTTDISQMTLQEISTIQSKQSDFRVDVDRSVADIALPLGSPFNDWKEARRYAGPLPHTFTFQRETNQVLIIEGVRREWKPQPVHVQKYHFSFIDQLGLKDYRLANAFEIHHVPYYWKKGKQELWP